MHTDRIVSFPENIIINSIYALKMEAKTSFETLLTPTTFTAVQTSDLKLTD
jgi:hypothetical protein